MEPRNRIQGKALDRWGTTAEPSPSQWSPETGFGERSAWRWTSSKSSSRLNGAPKQDSGKADCRSDVYRVRPGLNEAPKQDSGKGRCRSRQSITSPTVSMEPRNRIRGKRSVRARGAAGWRWSLNGAPKQDSRQGAKSIQRPPRKGLSQWSPETGFGESRAQLAAKRE